MDSADFKPLVQDSELRPWGTGIHIATGKARFLFLPLFNTTAVIDLPGGLLVWNPIALTDTLRASLAKLEETSGKRVTTLLAGLDFHHAVLGAWQEAHPKAETFLVSERIRDKQPGVRGTVLEGERPAIPGAEGVVELFSVRGCLQPSIERSPKYRDGRRREWFVRHVPSKSLLIGDMMHLNAHLSWFERKVLGFRPGFTPNKPGFRLGDRAERDAFLREVLALAVEQVLTVHGKSTAHGAALIRSELSRAYRL